MAKGVKVAKHCFIEDTDRNLITIFLVDDDKVDRLAVRRSFHKANILNPIVEAKDGEEALNLLKKHKMQQPIPPYLVLLDLNMPNMDGFEFLKEFRKDPQLKNAPIIILSTSNLENDKSRPSELGATGYVVKTQADEDLLKIIKSLPSQFHLAEIT